MTPSPQDLVKSLRLHSGAEIPGTTGELCAQAADLIERMMEPTQAMSDAVYAADLDIYWGYHADGRPSGAEDVYRIMIKAALALPAHHKDGE